MKFLRALLIFGLATMLAIQSFTLVMPAPVGGINAADIDSEASINKGPSKDSRCRYGKDILCEMICKNNPADGGKVCNCDTYALRVREPSSFDSSYLDSMISFPHEAAKQQTTYNHHFTMKEELRKYFPERFANSNLTEVSSKFLGVLSGSMNRRLKCEKKVADVFFESDELKLLAGAMKKHGCEFKLSRHLACELCKGCAGGYDPDTNQIVICMNNTLDNSRIMSTMMHEMIHMFDYCRAQFDFNNLDHVACSEIRAANLTYCSLSDKLRFPGPGLFDLKKTHEYCVKEVAYRSVKAYSPETDDAKIGEIINRVFYGCYNDLEPFGRRPLNGGRDLKQSYRERFYYGYLY